MRGRVARLMPESGGPESGEAEEAAAPLALPGMGRGDRARLGGPALRTFAAIADAWGLGEAERLAVLGQPGRSTYYGWLAKAQDGRPVSLSLDTLLRISAVLGVYKALALIFVRDGEALAWLGSANDGPVFGGQPPLSLITSGTQDGILLVRRYLDAWRGGQAAGPIAGAAFEQAPIADGDLVFA